MESIYTEKIPNIIAGKLVLTELHCSTHWNVLVTGDLDFVPTFHIALTKGANLKIATFLSFHLVRRIVFSNSLTTNKGLSIRFGIKT